MPAIRQEPQATSLVSTDAFVIDRLTQGTMYIEAVNLTNFLTAVTYVIDGGGAVPATGVAGALWLPFAGTIQAVSLLADQSGSCVVDIWKVPYASYNPSTSPTSANSITASSRPTISSGNKYQDTLLTGWTTKISAGDTLSYDLVSVSTLTRIAVVLQVGPPS